MPADDINAFLRTQLDDLKAKGLYKAERRIDVAAEVRHHRERRARSSTSARTTTSASRTTPTSWPRRTTG